MNSHAITHQAVTERPSENALFMVYQLNDNAAATERVKDLCGSFAAIVRSMRVRFPELDANAIIGFGSKAWGQLFPNSPKPKELKVFSAIKGAKHTAPSTPGDLFFHIRGKNASVCFELAAIISAALADAVTHIDEVNGFKYLDGRAIIGFVDGTENPEDQAALAAATIGAEDEAFIGGSYAFVQKYLHNMSAWNALAVEDQERVIGRKKFNDVELSDEEKPDNAHNAVTNIEDDDGNELKIVRANVAFANPSKNEFGTYFIGYAGKFSTTKKMLENMFIGEPRGNYDRLLDFSTAVTGTLFFVPSFDLLEDLAEEDA